MKRTPMPRRRTPLARTTGPVRRQVPAKARRVSTTSRARSVPVAQAIRDQLYDRCRGFCEWCGGFLPELGWHAHHRVRRAHGRDDSISNLVAVHGYCHVLGPTAIHERVGVATERGFLLRTGEIATDIPIRLIGSRRGRFLLTPDGRYEPAGVAL